MVISDCHWELKNLGESTVEIKIEPGDSACASSIDEAVDGYAYQVVKVPSGYPEFNFLLGSMGFVLIETQLHVSKRFRDFDFDNKLLKVVARDVGFQAAESQQQMKDIVSKISPDLFSTDRICLDPKYGPAVGRNRYVNWITSSFGNGTLLYEVTVKGKPVGFGFHGIREDGKVLEYWLGGIYEQYKSSGLGILTPASPFLYGRCEGFAFDKVDTHISSNNLPVVRLYNTLGYSIEGFDYIFVRHR